MRNTSDFQHFYLRLCDPVTEKGTGRKYPSNMRFGVIAVRKVKGGVRVAASLCSPEDVWDNNFGVNYASGKTLKKDPVRRHSDGTPFKNRLGNDVYDWVFVDSVDTKLWDVLVKLNDARAINYHYSSRFDLDDHERKFKRTLEDLILGKKQGEIKS